MGMDNIRRRLAALERSTEIVRVCIALPTPEGCEFFGYRGTPFYNADTRTEDLPADESFDVHGHDRAECAARAHLLANERWTDIPLLVISLRPITESPTPEAI